jgi:DNA-binding NarL/FixJ family response regulator
MVGGEVAMIRVLIVEDERALAGALEIAIDVQPDLDCVGAVGTAEEGVQIATELEPDVVLMDIHLPGVDGIEGTWQIKAVHPATRVFILTADASADLLTAAAGAGAAGFLAKDSAFPDILAAIRTPVDEKILIESSSLAALLDRYGNRDTPRQTPADTDWAGLTSREQEILLLMAEGLAPREISERLVLSVHTVRGHVKNVMMKLGAHSQLEAVVIATRSGLLRPAPKN